MAGLVGIRAEDMEQVDALQRAKLDFPQGLPFIRPSVRVPVLVQVEKKVDFKVARFGMSRRFTSFNARSENLTEGKLWKSMFGKSHAVAALSYIVEWKGEGEDRKPFLIGRRDGKLMMTPALFGHSLDDKTEFGFAICTREPNGFFKNFHDRMVGVLDKETMERWLDPASSTPAKLLECVRAAGEDELAAWAVKGDPTKRKSGDWSPVESTGKPLTADDFKAAPAKKKGGQAKLID